MSVTDEVKARLDIVDVVSDTVSLRKSGRNYTGFCPFHSNTKTPAFVVFPETQTWRCFGACADGGDIFSFVIKREGCDFKEALELLASRAGVQLEQPGPQANEQREQRDKLLELNAAAAAYFHNLLRTSPAAVKVRDYLAERDLTAETVATFQLGYALDEWEALKKHLTDRGYRVEDLLAAGLIVGRDGSPGEAGHDRFRNRLVIPIRDPQARVIGFGARALAPDQVPKYLNTPQTALFDKGATLYGLDLARKHIRQTDQVVIVEGYMDVIQAYQRGARNVVAQMGTALTEQQLKRVSALANRIVLALDADTAGNTATVRGLSVARQALPKKYRPTSTSRGIEIEGYASQEIYVASLPAGKDPDDILRAGLEAWQALIDQAVPSLDFYEQLIVSRADLTTPQGKSFVVGELIPIYQRLARQIGLNERLLMAELKGKQPPARAPSRRRPEAGLAADEPQEEMAAQLDQSGPVRWGLEEYCLALILANPLALALANEVLAARDLPDLTTSDFKRGDNKEIFKALQLWTATETPTIEVLNEMVDGLLEQRLALLANQWRRRPPALLEDVNRDLSKAILRLRLQNVIEQFEELQALQHQAEENKDTEDARRYTEMVEVYKRQRDKLDDTRDALSLMGQRRAEANQYGQAV
jgi:DNA primase